MSETRPRTFRVLGHVELSDAEGRTIPLRTRKTALLLAMLALNEGNWQSRGELAASIWVDAEEGAAREGLRTSLSALRRTLPEDAIITEGDRISLRSGVVGVPLDHADDGVFMPGFETEWAIDRRLDLQARFLAEALAEAESARREGRREDALLAIERGCRLDPWDANAANLRTELLREAGRGAEAVRRQDAYRVQVMRQLGYIPSSDSLSFTAENPLLSAVEWSLVRDPDEACDLLAATQSQWLEGTVERALQIHRRVLEASTRPTRERRIVEAGAELFAATLDPSGISSGRLEGLYREARTSGETRIADPLCEALAYGSLSIGRFADAMIYAQEGQNEARDRNDHAREARWTIHGGIIALHVGETEKAIRMVSEGVARTEEHGSAADVLNAQGAEAGFEIHRGRYEEAAERLHHQRRRIQSFGSERRFAWTFDLEARIHEGYGDWSRARAAYERFRELAKPVGQCAVAMADDGLMRTNLRLREYRDAADALARNAHYRRRKGSVASAFERSQNAPVVRALRERLGDDGLAAAFRRTSAD